MLPAAAEGLADLGIDVESLRRQRRSLVRPCLDRTERVDHVAGAVGAGLAATALRLGWVTRIPGSRGLRITGLGITRLADLGVHLP